MGHGFSSRDADFIMAVLRHPGGWGRRGHTFERVRVARGGGGPDVVMFLRPPSYMDERFATERLRGLSVTETSPGDPSVIHIHSGNWHAVPEGFEGGLRTYRAYLIQHEIGHCLGHGHEPVPPLLLRQQRQQQQHEEMPPCPVMYQQTRGTRGRCAPNYRPLDTEAR